MPNISICIICNGHEPKLNEYLEGIRDIGKEIILVHGYFGKKADKSRAEYNTALYIDC